MKTKRLTTAGKLLIFAIAIILIAGGVFAGVKTGFIKTKSDTKVSKNVGKDTNENSLNDTNHKDNNANNYNLTAKSTDTINLSLDEWVGYATILQANGGLTTQPGSIYDKLGIKVNISIINDATQSSNALIKGELDGAGYTVNRLAFLSNKFSNANVDVVMPYITNYSNGGDGIISLSSINTIEDLVNARIGVPQFSESQAMIVWFVNQSNLSQEDKDKIINNLILFETSDETAKAFFAGKIDVAGTWQPYLTQAENMTDSHILFSTANSTKLIMSGVIFRDDFAKQNPELISKFIDGTLQAMDSYDKDLDVLRNSMPMFNGMADDDIVGMTQDAALATWSNNMDILKEDAKTIYSNMCDVWTSIGETVDKSMVDSLFDTSYMESLRSKYETITDNSTNVANVTVTDDNKQSVLDATALLTKSATVNFISDTAKFVDMEETSAILNDFIEVAKILDGTIIQIEGNVSSNVSNEVGIKLSEQRANAVKNYLVANGIDPNRIIVIGNGGSKPLVPNDSEENKNINKRTDMFFKCIE